MTENPVTGPWPARAGAAPAEWPTIPGYEILTELGRGGMGVVYKARQASSGRLVALKLIRDGAMAGPQDRARLRIEAEAAARIHHPNVVQIYDVGEHQGLPYFAMELVEGGSLGKRHAGGPFPATEAAELVRALALAVQCAHEQKIIHRDLKPANVLLQIEVRDDSSALQSEVCNRQSAIPKISDFSLAKCLDSDSTAWTQDGAILGTAGYMAPEQAAGRVREIGPLVDVYALGAILYHLLTGRPPFRGNTLNLTVEQVLHDEPTPPTRLQFDVPLELETVCLKCLEKDPSRRYASAAALADDLGRFLEGQAVAAVPLSNEERLARLAVRDGFQLGVAIGRGPRSTVYRALHGPLKQPVAVKVFMPGVCTREEWEARLRRGADQWAALAHPQVVLPQRAGWWDDTPYVAVEYVPQGSLAVMLSSHPVHSPRSKAGVGGVQRALRLVEQLTEIVCYLHRQGVVHGNLKPSNVLLAADGIPRVSDFRPTSGLSLGPLSRYEGDPVGLGYLAPELVADPIAEPRPYTDVYGLGLILYELLTGRPPFAGATVRETQEQVRSQDPVPPSHINPEVMPGPEAFCLRCLRKNPWRRYDRAYIVLTRLGHFRDTAGGRVGPSQAKPMQMPPDRKDRSRRGPLS